MKLTKATEFYEALKTPHSVYLLVGKELFEPIDHFEKKQGPFSCTWDEETFSQERFEEEVNTPPFLIQKVVLHIKNIDLLKAKQIECITSYVEKPAPWVTLLLSSALKPSSSLLKEVEKKGLILQLTEEKPWDKEERFASWVVEYAKESMVSIGRVEAKTLIKSVGMDYDRLKNEIDKLFCFVGVEKKISSSAIRTLCDPLFSQTIWQLGEALFRLNCKDALTLIHGFMEAGESHGSLLASLRMQFQQAYDMLDHYQRGGVAALKEAYPQWKESFIRKKLEDVQKFGKTRLREALLLLFESELAARNSAGDVLLLMELLMIRICNAPSSSAERLR